MICTLCDTTELECGSLCRGCVRATHDRLRRLPRMWASLEAWLAPGSSVSTSYGRTPMIEAPLPVVGEVLDLRAAGGIVGVLEDWREAVYETRGWDQPVRATSLAHRVAIAAADLDHHLDWISRWYAGAAFGEDVRQLVARIYSVVQPGHEVERPTLLGYCIAVDTSGIVCGSKIYADMGRPVQCDWCLCPYPPDAWLALRHHQPGRAAALEGQDDDAEDLAA